MISRRYHAIIYKGQKLVNDLIYMGCLREFVRLNWVNLVFRHVGGDATSLCTNVFPLLEEERVLFRLINGLPRAALLSRSQKRNFNGDFNSSVHSGELSIVRLNLRGKRWVIFVCCFEWFSDASSIFRVVWFIEYIILYFWLYYFVLIMCSLYEYLLLLRTSYWTLYISSIYFKYIYVLYLYFLDVVEKLENWEWEHEYFSFIFILTVRKEEEKNLIRF